MKMQKNNFSEGSVTSSNRVFSKINYGKQTQPKKKQYPTLETPVAHLVLYVCVRVCVCTQRQQCLPEAA